MSAIPADRVVMMSGVLTTMSTVGASVMPKDKGGQGKLPSPRLLLGTAITFIGLSFLSDAAPSLAKPLSASIAIMATSFYGFPILEKAFSPEPSPKPTRIVGSPRLGNTPQGPYSRKK